MLPVFVESLGGKFVKSDALSEQDLAAADVLVLLHPDEPWPKDTLERVWEYVRRGGSLLLVAEPAIHEGRSQSSFNDVLQPTAMQVRFDTAVTRSGNWEQSYEVLAHPATAGIDDLRNRFGVQLGSSIRTRWPARPVLVGRWGWSDPGSDAVGTGVSNYNAGKLLGDLVLAAEQPLGPRADLRARRHVDRSTTKCSPTPTRSPAVCWATWPTSRRVRRTFGGNCWAWPRWRHWLALLALRPAAWQVDAHVGRDVGVAASVARRRGIGRAACCPTAARIRPAASTTSPTSTPRTWRPTAATCDANTASPSLLRALMRHGYLPLLAPDLTEERIERAGLLISIAPARGFSRRRAKCDRELSGGGRNVHLHGGRGTVAGQCPAAGRFRFSRAALAGPAGRKCSASRIRWAPCSAAPAEGNWQTQFYAAWPVESLDADGQKIGLLEQRHAENGSSSGAARSAGGTVVVIGDTNFASNENFEMDEDTLDAFLAMVVEPRHAGARGVESAPGAETPPPETVRPKKDRRGNPRTDNEGTATKEVRGRRSGSVFNPIMRFDSVP